jgi:hypothetical protein
MATPIAGRKGRLYADTSSAGTGSAQPIINLNSWSISQATDRTEVTSFGDSTKTYIAGLRDASGDFGGFHDTDGELYKIVPATFVGPDCDNNSVRDACQILANPALDANRDGILDSCAPPPVCAGDANGDLVVDGSDLSILLGNFSQTLTGPSFGDFNNDGVIDGADLSILLSNFGSAC